MIRLVVSSTSPSRSASSRVTSNWSCTCGSRRSSFSDSPPAHSSVPDEEGNQTLGPKSDPFEGSRPPERGPDAARGPTRSGEASQKTFGQVLSGPRTRSDRANVLRLGALGTLGDVELNLLVLVEGLVALRLNRRVVHEDVVAAVLLRNEAETLLGVE